MNAAIRRLPGGTIAMLALCAILAAPAGMAATTGKTALTPEEIKRGKEIFMQRCAGCHGASRKGGIGKQLAPELLRADTDYYKAFISHGSEAGMPQFEGELSARDIDILARYVQSDEESPPDWGARETTGSWKVLVPVDKRPARKFNTLDLEDLFAVVLGEPGQVALVDGHSKRVVEVVKTGYAVVHTTRISASGRYLYALGRDATLTLVDLWLDPPQPVAQVRAGLEARSLEVSKAKGFEDRYVIVGDTWPAQYVILDGRTLKPLVFNSTKPAAAGGKSRHTRARVADIAASMSSPEFVVSIKETGKILLVDYSQITRVYHTVLDGTPFLAGGGFDASGRYYLAAANLANRVVVVDTKQPKIVKTVETGNKPNPSQGANFVDPKFGPVWATGHLGDSSVAVIGTDPAGHPGSAWKVVRKLRGPASGCSSIRTHRSSHNLWVDFGLNPERPHNQTVAVWDIRALDKPPQTLQIAKLAGITEGRVSDGAYNRFGDEIWFSVTGRRNQQSAIVVLDDRARKVKAVIKDPRLVAPTAKFNAYNTRFDLY